MTDTATRLTIADGRSIPAAAGVDVDDHVLPRFVRVADGMAAALSLSTIRQGHALALAGDGYDVEQGPGLDYAGGRLYAVIGNELIPANTVLARPQRLTDNDYFVVDYAILIDLAAGPRYVGTYTVHLDGRA